jgi:transposase
MGDDRLNNCPRPPTRRGRKKGDQNQAQNQALGRSCGGVSTKIHAACDALGNPIRFILTGGEASDDTQALTLLDGVKTTAILADKGYDANYIADAGNEMGAEVVIPSKSNRKETRFFDKDLYKERNLMERMFNKIKHFRRVATRYDKTASAYRGLHGLLEFVCGLNNMSTLPINLKTLRGCAPTFRGCFFAVREGCLHKACQILQGIGLGQKDDFFFGVEFFTERIFGVA